MKLNNALGIVSQTIREAGKPGAVGMDSEDVEAVFVPAATVGHGPIAISREDDAFTVRGPARCVVPAVCEDGSHPACEVEDM